MPTPTGTITVTIDAANRTVVLLPDDTARRMRTHITTGWRTLTGVATGHSAAFAPDTWIHQVTLAILAAVAASPDVDEHTRAAATGTQPVFHGCITGASDWDPTTNWWRNYRANPDLHIPGNPYWSTDGLRYAG